MNVCSGQTTIAMLDEMITMVRSNPTVIANGGQLSSYPHDLLLFTCYNDHKHLRGESGHAHHTEKSLKESFLHYAEILKQIPRLTIIGPGLNWWPDFWKEAWPNFQILQKAGHPMFMGTRIMGQMDLKKDKKH